MDWTAPVSGIVGTLAGASLGGIFALRLERMRGEREERRRWDEARRVGYGRLIAATSELAMAFSGIDEAAAVPRDLSDDEQEAISHAIPPFTAAHAAAELLASDETLPELDELADHYYTLMGLASLLASEGEAEQAKTRLEDADKAADAFLAAVRRELGVSTMPADQFVAKRSPEP